MDGSMFRGLDKVLYVALAILVVGIGGGGVLCGRHSMSKYKEKWEENSKNEPFWREVLVGRKIVDLRWKDGSIDCLVLDSGQEVFIHKNKEGVATLMIED